MFSNFLQRFKPQNPYAPEEQVDPQALPMSPMTADYITAQLPDIQKRMRRAKRLRDQQAQFQTMASKDYDLGSVSPTQRGGLYQTVGSYIPNYRDMAQQAVGGIGEMLTNRQADRAEENLDVVRDPQIMGALGGIGAAKPAPGSATESQLRGYLGMIGGPDIKDVVGKPLRVQSTKTDSKGNVWAVMSDGSTHETGIKEKYGFKVITDPATGDLIQVPISSVGEAQFPNDPNDASNAQPPAPPLPGTPDGAPAMNLTGMSPDRQREVQDKVTQLLGMGIPQSEINAYVTREQAKDQQAGLPAGQQAGAGVPLPDEVIDTTNEGPAAPVPGAPPAPAPVPGAPPAPGVAPPVPAPAPVAQQMADTLGMPPVAPRRHLRIGSDAEVAGAVARAKERGTLETDIAMAPQINEVAAQKAAAVATAETDVKRAATAADTLPDMESDRASLADAASTLLSDPNLDEMVGKSVWARISETGEVGSSIAKFWHSGTPQADTLLRIANMKAKVFMPAFRTLKGGGQITENEGNKAQQAMSDMSQAQTPAAFRASVQRFLDAYDAGIEKMKQVAAGKYSTSAIRQRMGGAAAPAVPALPSGFSWEP